MRRLTFKTNLRCQGCIEKISEALNRSIESKMWSVDLESPDKTLTVTTDKSPEEIIGLLAGLGFKAELTSKSEDNVTLPKYDC